MAVPQNKEALLKEIITSSDKLITDLKKVPEDLAFKKSMEGHAKDTNMSVANLLSYVIGWGELVLKWHNNTDNNESVDFPETGYKWNELGKLAQKFYDDYQQIPFNELLQKYEVTVGKLIDLVASKTNHELYEKPWYNQWTMGRMIQFNTSSPYKNSRIRLRKWMKEQQEIN